MAYKYTSPLEKGFHKFKLTKKQHNDIFKYRKIRWTDEYEYYYNDNSILLHKFYSWRIVALSTVLFPVTIFLVGILNIKEAWRDLIKLYKQKESGSFVSEVIWSKDEKYQQVLKAMIKNLKII